MNRFTDHIARSIFVIAMICFCADVASGQVGTPGIPSGGGNQPAMSPGRLPSNMPLPPTESLPGMPGGGISSAGGSPSGASNIPLPPTASMRSNSVAGTSGGWVSGPAALEGGPFPAYMTGYGAPGGSYFGASGNATSASRPYANYSSPQAVSPYLNLFRNNSSLGTAGNYYTLVRPQIEQQRVNQQLSRRIDEVRSGYAAPTGRAAGAGGYFMNYYGYFSTGPR